MRRALAPASLVFLLAGTSAVMAQEGDHAAHQHPASPAATSAESIVPSPNVAPARPDDHAADRYYDPAVMAQARRALAYESGGMPFSLYRIDRLETTVGERGDGFRWEGEATLGGDINRFAFKTQGEGEWTGGLEQAEIQALYSRAVGPYFNLQAGLRHDIRPSPQRSYAVVAIEGLAPYWFEVSGEAFVSNKGDVHLRLEAEYDQRITQRWILQPQAELNIAAQDVPEIGIGSGLSSAEAGLRLRYEVVPEFAPYIGISWERKFGGTGRLAEAAGEKRGRTAFVLGLRTWF